MKKFVNSLFFVKKPYNTKNLLDSIFDFNLYENSRDEYKKLKNKLNFNTTKDVDYALELIQKLPCKEKYSYSFNPVSDLLKFFNRNQQIKQKILDYYFAHITPVLKLIFKDILDKSSGTILETLYCARYYRGSVIFFIEIVTDITNEVDNYDSYQSIKRFSDSNLDIIAIFIKNSDKLLKHNKFRTVAFVELFSQWSRDGKLSYNPVQNHLTIIKKWITDKNYENLSYAVSGCAALSQIDSDQSIKLLRMATKHPKLEIQLEAVFSLILLGHKTAKKQLRLLAQNPIISNQAWYYSVELKLDYKIDCGFTQRDIIPLETDEEDFIAMSTMSEWCAYPQEYGITPDYISVFAKEEVFWPSSEDKLKIYLVKYRYNNYCWQGKITNLEHIGCYNPSSDSVFSIMKNFDSIEDAYAAYRKCNSVY